MRPSIIFGREDAFINRFAGMMRMLPVLPVVAPKTRFQPVYAADAGRAITAAALHPGEHGGKTYELGGPQAMSMRELMQWINGETGYSRFLLDVPDPIANALAVGLGWAPGAPITKDQWMMLKRDNVVSPGTPGLEAFGIRPTPLAAVSEGWLTAYRRNGRFAAKQPY
jgi:NADH dehydrogenase